MTISNEIFNAILSMDSYNRGYNASIEFDKNEDGSSTDLQIGNALIVSESDIDEGTPGVNAGFYALAYSYNGETIVSYRGTDDPINGVWDLLTSQDVWNGWTVGTGSTESLQAEMAIDFYKLIAGEGNYLTANVSLTGHSLGGGLAGLVGAIYGQDVDAYDAMPFLYALGNTVDELAGGNTALQTLIYGNETPWAIATDHTTLSSLIDGAYLAGEALEIIRNTVAPDQPEYQNENALYGDIYPANYGDYVSYLDPVQLHSPSTLVIRMFAEESEQFSNTPWQTSAQYFWPVLYDDDFAEEIGAFNVTGSLASQGKYSDILRSIIAYSAIEHEEDAQGNVISQSVFGDTGIRALYDDANDLGEAITVAGAGSAIETYATDISKAFVQFSGQLALAKITQSDFATATNGVLTYTPDAGNQQLSINFTDALWAQAASAEAPVTGMIARFDLLTSLFADMGNETEIRAAMGSAWGDDSFNAINYITFAIDDDITFSDTGDRTLIVGDTNTSITGSTGDELFFGSDGDDKINGGGGNDIIFGGAGNDTFSTTSSGFPYFDGGEGYDVLDDSYSLPGYASNYNNDAVIEENYYISNSVTAYNFEEFIIGSNGSTTENGHIYTAALGTTFNVDNRSYTEQVDYSNNNNSLNFDISSTGWSVQDTTANLSDSYINIQNARANFVGSIHGDTINFSNTSEEHKIWLGTGDDIVTVASDGDFGTIIYSGGDDTLSLNGNTGIFVFDSSIQGVDVSITETNKTLCDSWTIASRPSVISKYYWEYELDIEVSVANKGTITINDVHVIEHYAVAWGDGQNRINHSDAPTFKLWNYATYSYDVDGYSLNGNGTFTAHEATPFSGATLNAEYGYLRGSQHSDTLTGSDNDDQIVGNAGDDFLYGLIGNDQIHGSLGNDTIDGGDGDDELRGEGGNDLIIAGAGSNYYYGGAGVDTVDYSSSSGSVTFDTAYTVSDNGFIGNGNDYIDVENVIGSSNDDTIIGNGGNNILTGGAGADTLYGGYGNDTFVWNTGDGDDVIQDWSGTGTIKLGTGITSNDVTVSSNGTDLLVNIDTATLTINYHASSDAYKIETLTFADGSTLDLTGGLNFEATISGGSLYGTTGNEQMVSGSGVDYLYGGSGSDTYHFETIADLDYDQVIDSAGANDVVTLGASLAMSDIHFNDTIYAGQHLVVFAGGGGHGFGLVSQLDASYPDYNVEYLEFSDGYRFDLENYQNWYNAIYAASAYAGSNSDEVIIGDAGDNIFSSLDGDDLFLGSAGNDQLFGGDGIDTVDYSAASARIVINLHSGSASENGYGSADSKIKKIENVIGTAQDDIVTGSNDANVLTMGDGSDYVQAKAGEDTLYGGAGNDDLRAGEDNDTLYGGTGDDDLYGNQNEDILYGEDGADRLYGGADNDILYGGEGDDIVLSGEFGDDLIYGGNGNDLLHGNQDNDTLYGEAGNDTVKGQEGNDIVYGGDGDDTVVGDSGSDVLYGGAGLNTLIGGTEDDTFVFEAANAFDDFDFIQDFSVADGDALDLSDLLSGYDAGAGDLLTDFVQITEAGSSSLLYVDTAGTSTFNNSNLIAKLVGTNDIAAGGSGTNASEAELLGITIF